MLKLKAVIVLCTFSFILIIFAGCEQETEENMPDYAARQNWAYCEANEINEDADVFLFVQQFTVVRQIVKTCR